MEFSLQSEACHDNVLESMSLSFKRDSANMCLEYCSGGSLESMLQMNSGRAISIDETLLYFLQILNGLEHLHKKLGIAHRGIKPFY
jgi:serine/threonine protein kinase